MRGAMTLIKKGNTLPCINLITMGTEGPETISTDDLFKGKKVVILVYRVPSPRPVQPNISRATPSTQGLLKPTVLILLPVYLLMTFLSWQPGDRIKMLMTK